jgi:hypothetical protein
VEPGDRHGVGGLQRIHQGELAPHLVGGPGFGPGRRPAQDQAALAEGEQVGQVRHAAGELSDLRVAAQARNALAQRRADPRGVELLAWPHGDGLVGTHQARPDDC